MQKRGFYLLLPLCLLGCKQKELKPVDMDDLSTLKRAFLQQMFISNVEEGPFSFNYQFRTVFSSRQVTSLFGVLTVHDRLPHGWKSYEGKTFCIINNQYKEVILDDLFVTDTQREFLRKTCENHLKKENASYFAGHEPLRTTLSLEDIRTFVMDNRHLIIIFQPYSVGGCIDGPFLVKLPFSDLQGHWEHSHPIHSLLKQAIGSCTFTSSWDLEESQECQVIH